MSKFFLLLIAALLLLLGAESARSQTVVDFSGITYWVGSGSNEAAMVIDWNNGSTMESFVWGYRWDGMATGMDMLEAITTDDARLEYNPVPGFPTAVYAFYYDFDGDGGGFVQGAIGVEDGSANDPDDYYAEGWLGGFWSYWLNSPSSPGDEPYNGGDWEFSAVGMADRDLFDGAWDGWSFDADGFGGTTFLPEIPVAAIPEPSIMIYLIGGLLGLLFQRRRN
ncbi:MAG: hypothetical protein AAGH72_06095 [Verrucomicrobiota bacterium]